MIIAHRQMWAKVFLFALFGIFLLERAVAAAEHWRKDASHQLQLLAQNERSRGILPDTLGPAIVMNDRQSRLYALDRSTNAVMSYPRSEETGLLGEPTSYDLDQSVVAPLALGRLREGLLVIASLKGTPWLVEPARERPGEAAAAQGVPLADPGVAALRLTGVRGAVSCPDGSAAYVAADGFVKIAVIGSRKAAAGVEPTLLQVVVDPDHLKQLSAADRANMERSGVEVLETAGCQDCGGIALSPDGKFVYAVGGRKLSWFKADQSSKKLVFAGALSDETRDGNLVTPPFKGLIHVADVAVSAEGAYVMTVSSAGTITIFRRDLKTGELTLDTVFKGDSSDTAFGLGARHVPHLKKPLICAAHPGGRAFIAVESSGTIWRCTYNEEQQAWKADVAFDNTAHGSVGLEGPVTATFSSDGRFMYLATRRLAAAVFEYPSL